MELRRIVKPAALAAVMIAAASLAAEREPEWVDQRVQAWQPSAREKLWESIGWAGDIRHALRLAREHNRPVFLFTLDGRMNVGRC
jgi:hypothetical protein